MDLKVPGEPAAIVAAKRHLWRRSLTKTLLVMKITTVILLACCLQVSASGYSQQISLSEKNAPLKKVFALIEKQADVTFYYQEELLATARNVDITLSNATLQQALDYCFRDQPFTYELIGKTVVIKGKVREKPVNEAAGKTSPPGEVKIHVTDSAGAALANATVVIKGTKRGGQTDAQGNITLTNIDDEAKIIISFTGFENKEINLKGRTALTISLKAYTSQLDETMVIAYGTTTQRFNVGSVSSVKAEDIAKQPVTNPLQALEGRVAGLVVTQSSGLPGASLKIQIRGQNSLLPKTTTGNVLFDNPLFIIDGMPFAPQNSNIGQYGNTPISPKNPDVLGASGLSPFNSINPGDIESIEILKDADATAIYGSRGANGVVLITTKRGRIGKTRLETNVWTGISHITRSLPLMNTQEYLTMRKEAFSNDGLIPANGDPYDPAYAPDLLVFDTTRYVDWKKYLIGGTAQTTDVNTLLSGGNNNSQFLVGAGYHHETYIYPGDFADKRLSVNFNFRHNSSDKKLFLDLSANYSYDNNNLTGAGAILQSVGLPPNFPELVNPDGSLNWIYKGIDIGNYGLVGANPLAYLRQPYSIKNYNLISHFQIGYQIFPGLTVKSSFGYNTFDGNEYIATPKLTQDPAGPRISSAYFGANNFQTWIIEPQAEYKKKFGRGKLNILIGSTFQKNTNNSTKISASNFPNDVLLGSIAAAGTTTSSGNYSLYKYSAFFARLNYIWNSKYIINLTGRRDGSSRFGPGRQFGNFYAVGGGWLFSEESFIKNSLPVISYGKLRTSYGTTGNDNIGNYQYLPAYNAMPNVSYQGSVGYEPLNLYNPEFSWAVTEKFEVGLELGLFKDHILTNITWFRNTSSNQLINYALPSQTGFTAVLRNAPYTVENNGFEIEIQSTNIRTRKFTWSTAFNITIPKNKLASFPGINTSSYNTVYVVGQPLTVLKKFVYAGVNDTTGLFQYETSKGALSSAPSGAADYKIIGNLSPKFYGGINNTVSYKGFELFFFFQFVKQLGANYFYQIYNLGYPIGYSINLPKTFLQRWQKEGDHTNIQKFSTQYADAYNAGSNFWLSSGAYSDASFIRLKTLSLSYKFLNGLLKKSNPDALAIYVNAQNLFTITSYKGNDPEIQDFYSLPPLRTISAGFRYNF